MLTKSIITSSREVEDGKVFNILKNEITDVLSRFSTNKFTKRMGVSLYRYHDEDKNSKLYIRSPGVTDGNVILEIIDERNNIFKIKEINLNE